MGHLVSLIPISNSALAKSLNTELGYLAACSSKFREHRNRRIGHYDLATRQSHAEAILPNVGINDVDDCLKNLATLLNMIEEHYDRNSRTYNEGIYGSGDAEELLGFFERAEKLERYFNRNEIGDDDEADAE
jgi:hypothetical protein